MSSKQKIIFIQLALLAMILTPALIYSWKNPPQYCSNDWKSENIDNVTKVTLLPIQDKYYSQTITIDKTLEINDKDNIKTITSLIDGKYEWWNYLNGFEHWSHLKDFNIKIETEKGKTYFFKFKFYIDDSFIWYSELLPGSYTKPGDLQKIYGDEKASKELAVLITKILAENNIKWVQAYKGK